MMPADGDFMRGDGQRMRRRGMTATRHASKSDEYGLSVGAENQAAGPGSFPVPSGSELGPCCARRYALASALNRARQTCVCFKVMGITWLYYFKTISTKIKPYYYDRAFWRSPDPLQLKGIKDYCDAVK
jgi:hypothetical protein